MRFTLTVALAILLAFAAGAAGGYTFRGLTTQVAAAQREATSACPAGEHAVVWYTARTWACLPSS